MNISNIKIMVVDDEQIQLDLLTAILQYLGYSVVPVKGGEKAIAYLKENQVDLLLLDMQMDPGMNGRETYEAALEIFPKQKAIIVSGYGESKEIKRVFALGACLLVRKPYTITELSLGIQECLGW
jgi:two-component system, cell cycle sensor histidine kinase and response regulator CckA